MGDVVRRDARRTVGAPGRSLSWIVLTVMLSAVGGSTSKVPASRDSPTVGPARWRPTLRCHEPDEHAPILPWSARGRALAKHDPITRAMPDRSTEAIDWRIAREQYRGARRAARSLHWSNNSCAPRPSLIRLRARRRSPQSRTRSGHGETGGERRAGACNPCQNLQVLSSELGTAITTLSKHSYEIMRPRSPSASPSPRSGATCSKSRT